MKEMISACGVLCSGCAECEAAASCPMLEKAQSVWDGVPKIAATLSPVDIEAYARPYLDHRGRLTRTRIARSKARR